MEQQELFPVPKKEIAQHNNLIFANFTLSSIENKIFISMLERINRNDEEFLEWRIPINEILKHKNGDNYDELKRAAKLLTSHSIDIAPANSSNPYTKGFKYRNLVSKCDHDHGKGYLVCKFSDDIKEYLLKLTQNFTRADFAVLKNFKSEKSVRFYWMLKSRFYNKNEIIITVEECRQALLPKESIAYNNPSDLKKHILDKIIKPEIDQTDCAFTYGDPIRKGNKTTAWIFVKKDGAFTILKDPIKLSNQLCLELESVGIDNKGLNKISEVMGKNFEDITISEEYVRFVLYKRKNEKAKKAINSLGGYVISSIVEGHLIKEFKLYLSKKTEKKTFPSSVKYITLDEARKQFEFDKQQSRTRAVTLEGYIKILKMQDILVIS